jgi:putative transposase
MARPLRLEFAGALYHVTARGDRKEEIYLDNNDRSECVALLGEICERFNWTVHAYCLMTNHYHLVVETPDANLSMGMRQFNGVYTQRFNRRHARVGHVFQGRYHGVLVQKQTYLLELTRYVVLNPVRARMVDEPGHWPWSSYGAMVGNVQAPTWLAIDWLLAQFSAHRNEAINGYKHFVQEGRGAHSPWLSLKHQAILGDDAFVEKFRDLRDTNELSEIPKTQRRPLSGALSIYSDRYPREEAMARAYFSGAYTMKEIGDFFGVHYVTVSRAVRKHEKRNVGM